ncbi:MAG: class I SAM-dependent methyltransferase [SAR324 cluster bacterium]|uniref:Class I SAM-dependent methyltransferase n=1 Tax=SAR324 cluster bacterium TaxID=2024889 RepID=A0A7X9FQE8_9DELT|nr:class I SAM-dependent methyltransferase [SAR324 cluster bacterium]
MTNIAPDIESASKDYQSRFEGEIGRYFLEVQAKTLLSLLPPFQGGSLKILEIGGGHGQLFEPLLKLGHEVWVQGSSAEALWRIDSFKGDKSKLHCIQSPLDSLPFEDKFFDVVLNVRVVAHIDNLSSYLKEWCRVAKMRVIFDYPPLLSFNVFYPLFFRIKKVLEKNTRTFKIYKTNDFKKELDVLGWEITEIKKQFFVPMVIHRKLNNARRSFKIEEACANLGLTALLGSPAILAAQAKINKLH